MPPTSRARAGLRCRGVGEELRRRLTHEVVPRLASQLAAALLGTPSMGLDGEWWAYLAAEPRGPATLSATSLGLDAWFMDMGRAWDARRGRWWTPDARPGVHLRHRDARYRDERPCLRHRDGRWRQHPSELRGWAVQRPRPRPAGAEQLAAGGAEAMAALADLTVLLQTAVVHEVAVTDSGGVRLLCRLLARLLDRRVARRLRQPMLPAAAAKVGLYPIFTLEKQPLNMIGNLV